MKVVVTVTGYRPSGSGLVNWPPNWPIPRVGEEVSIPGAPPLFVRHVDWYPEGDRESKEPFVYVVISATRVGGR